MEVVKVALRLQKAELDKIAVTTVDNGYSYAQVLRSAFALSSVLEKELATPAKVNKPLGRDWKAHREPRLRKRKRSPVIEHLSLSSVLMLCFRCRICCA